MAPPRPADRDGRGWARRRRGHRDGELRAGLGRRSPRRASTEGQHAYLVDGRGRLIAHPDLGLVREGTDLSSSAQVRAVREGHGEGRQQYGSTEVVDSIAPSVMVVSQFDPSDERAYGSSRDRLVAYGIVEPTGWITLCRPAA